MTFFTKKNNESLEYKNAISIAQIFNDKEEFHIVNLNEIFSNQSYEKVQAYCLFNNPAIGNVATHTDSDIRYDLDYSILLSSLFSHDFVNGLPDYYFAVLATTKAEMVFYVEDIASLSIEVINQWIAAFKEYEQSVVVEEDLLNLQPYTVSDDDGDDIHSKLNRELWKVELELDKHIASLKANDLEFIIAKVLMKHYSQEEIPQLFGPSEMMIKPPVISRLYISNNYKIFFTLYNDKELILPPVQKALYILFLKHSDGIMIKEIGNYKSELSEIYAILTNKSDVIAINDTIDRLCHPFDNSLNEKCAKINAALYKLFDKPIAKEYIITGGRNEPKYIPIARKSIIRWQKELGNMTLRELEELEGLDSLF